ncbi:T9SS type A sorting domain-containing protein [Fluviicola sp.]|jgi:hypothetical protein|uniref:T9SS type A sorting domain-containing protein n=1 Tax=Fluviicola sp. TaxID=1917219 RepID=UPI002822CDFF|nr:T9SS type A sorting domain-containing protein [Fluviicola sp.]MDR0803451.1 T9SS type A sorting domain-containing protein [Fluviicola sp.]
MKKVYLGLFSIALTALSNAQVNSSIVSIKQSRYDSFQVSAKKDHLSAKTEGDVLWTNDFSTPSDWTIGNNPTGTPPHTLGDWAIVNALPTSLTSQAPTYGFPTTIGSGNFALVNSDAAGSGQTQNTYIETTVALASILTTNGSSPNTPIYLKFTEIYRHFYDKNFVQISNDGGATWTTIEVNPISEVPVNTNSANPEFETVNISSILAGGNWTNNVKIRFLYQGDYDWFWAIDDVKLVEAYANDAKITMIAQSTDAATTEGLDYYRIPVSQTSFPGLTFGAQVLNNGGSDQANVTLKVTGPGSYSQTSNAVSVAAGATDTLEITAPCAIPAAAANYTIDYTTDLGAGVTDGDPTNNQKSITVVRDQYLYGRDNNNPTGGITQVTSQDGAELKIGNLMEVFNQMEVAGVQVRLLNQAAAVGQEINCVIEIYNANTQSFDYFAETEYYEIQQADLANFVTIPIDGGSVSIPQGSLILVMAHHLGGANEVGFAYAQPTFQGSVLGYTADGNRFQLTDPGAIMIRLSENPSLSVAQNAANVNVNVFPNPVVGEATVEVNGAVASTVTVVDLTGKIVHTTTASEGISKVTFDTTHFAAGVYTVNISTDKGTVTKKMIVKN